MLLKRIWKDERGVSNLITTLMVMPLMLFLCFAVVPYLVYVMKINHLYTIASHALKEAESIGYVDTTVTTNITNRLSELGLGTTVVSSVNYPSFTGSTTSKILRDAADPTVVVVIKYPASNLSKMLSALGASGSNNVYEGFYYLKLSGRSEAYN